MKLTIPDCPPSLNRTWNMHHWDRTRLKQYWKSLIRAELPSGTFVPIEWAGKKASVAIVLHHSREYDPDNLVGAAKPVIDALKHWGLIHDDSPTWITLSVSQAKCPRKQRHTEISIEPEQ